LAIFENGAISSRARVSAACPIGIDFNNTNFFFCHQHSPGVKVDRIDVRFFNILFRRYPELDFDVRRKIIQGHMAAVHWTNRGMSKKQEPYENEGVTLLELKGDEITFMSNFFKDTDKF
ncbi:MAG: nuclear transport factor 2 family protein, partial [Deltaproteobacteria bacterium]|nr:nuclear transport factor 2 family protein [Deltaproteobacteria bacterium]